MAKFTAKILVQRWRGCIKQFPFPLGGGLVYKKKKGKAKGKLGKRKRKVKGKGKRKGRECTGGANLIKSLLVFGSPITK